MLEMTDSMIKISAMQITNCTKDEYIKELIKAIDTGEVKL